VILACRAARAEDMNQGRADSSADCGELGGALQSSCAMLVPDVSLQGEDHARAGQLAHHSGLQTGEVDQQKLLGAGP
jgi:hypothetical protein